MIPEPGFITSMVGRIADLAGVSTATARECLAAGMREMEAIQWLRWGRRRGLSTEQVIESWRQAGQAQRRRVRL